VIFSETYLSLFKKGIILDMSKLTDTFEHALDAFNDDAKTKKNYNVVKQFLDSNVVLGRVDDATSVAGVPNVIINYLNGSQRDKWPRLDWRGGSARTESVVGAIGNVHGEANYTDNTEVASPPYPVRYCFRFRQNSKGDWLLAAAYAAPI
jgi:hypothetical protein